MAAPQWPTSATTASACIPDSARGTHVFTVAGYRLHKGIGVGNFIRSATFAVGGYHWCVRYYPDGFSAEYKDYVSVYVELQSKNSVVRALYDLRLTNRATGLSSLIFSRPSSFPAFDSCKNDHVRGAYMFMKRDLLEASPYLQDDCIVIQCDVTVLLKKIPAVATATTKTPEEIQVPPSDLLNNLAMLLEGKKGADVVMKVGEETFYAHKIVLAMRSPVFDAELYGPMAMWDKEKQCIQIVDMQPAVFRALLHFIYTDSLPAMDDLLDSHDKREMIRHLLVAADRYAMDRLKLMCEAILCKGLDAESVAATLALADQHRCSKLRDASIEYIKLFC
ncbi:BTB/POZ and MATH domain-containing protein 1-like [Triticum urartu]|uniref:BTB/POZ and MATH domain-containing protein 1-like n=1 Tax=Triticum urartu TaxID=4572 RepID=UPI0020434D42|nr:BTB/POZ and MATH domain-containing protein 1-like [Triticum urartu]XP_048538378.1 BTB/POZ and MATH domain-containing protein 1-like [Triticum urartu]